MSTSFRPNWLRVLSTLLLTMAAGPWFSALAAPGKDNCYDRAKVPPEHRQNSVHTVVLLDETTVFDNVQRQHIQSQLAGLLEDGSTTELIFFSAFSQGRYSMPGPVFKLAAALPAAVKYDLRKDDVQDFEVCLLASKKRAAHALSNAVDGYFSRATSDLARSDIFAVLKDIGETVLPRTTARDRRIVLVSDMLENSDISSFYSRGVPRAIKPEDELAKLKSKGMIADLRRVKVFVIGAAVVPHGATQGHDTYRPASVLGPLKAFWASYFQESNSQLVAFGQPLLLSPIVEMGK